jgi:hypothetical protein
MSDMAACETSVIIRQPSQAASTNKKLISLGTHVGNKGLSVPLMENRIRRAKPRKSKENSQHQQRLLPLPHNLLVPEGPVDLGREEFVMIQLLHEWVL